MSRKGYYSHKQNPYFWSLKVGSPVAHKLRQSTPLL